MNDWPRLVLRAGSYLATIRNFISNWHHAKPSNSIASDVSIYGERTIQNGKSCVVLCEAMRLSFDSCTQHLDHSSITWHITAA
jgi:hypothetical protein